MKKKIIKDSENLLKEMQKEMTEMKMENVYNSSKKLLLARIKFKEDVINLINSITKDKINKNIKSNALTPEHAQLAMSQYLLEKDMKVEEIAPEIQGKNKVSSKLLGEKFIKKLEESKQRQIDEATLSA